MQFQLNKANAKITSLNPRAEKHGEDNVPACDIGFELNAHSSVLDYFDPTYRPFLFRSPDRENDQPSLVPGENMTSLAKPNLKPLSLDESFPGYTLRIGSGLELGRDLVLTGVNLSGFKIEAIDGGSVKLKFSAACHPDADECGALYEQIQDLVDLSLEPPKPGADQQLPLGGEGDTLEQQEQAEA
jgi:hypothetical protein